MSNIQSLRTGANIVERAGQPIAASQMRAAATEIERLRVIIDGMDELLKLHAENEKPIT